MFHFKMMHIKLWERILNQSQSIERHTKKKKRKNDMLIIYLLRINVPGTRITTEPLEKIEHPLLQLPAYPRHHPTGKVRSQ